jgi:hypothetical protein
MIPTIPEVLGEIAGIAIRNADPAVHPADRASALGLSAALLGMAAEVWDGMADRLAAENAAIRRILAKEPAYADLARGADPSLRISVLKAANDRLRAALIDLHAAAEARADQALCEEIWRELVASTERRKLMASPV